ncbi:AP2/ERF family transcription factor [Acetivibrio cellulolyticus]
MINMPIIVGKKGELIIVDPLDYEKANLYKWYAAHNKKGFIQILTRINGKRVSYSTVIFGLSKNQRLLHKNGDSYDFSRENILICNYSEFMHYIMKQSGKSSKYFGVYYDNRFKRWKVRIKKREKIINAGGYLQEDEAAIAADYLTFKYYGNVDKRNFPNLDRSEIESLFDELQYKYGYTSIEKNSKSNQGRKTLYKECSSHFVGVTWDKQRKKWIAQTNFNQKHIFIGRFVSEEEAARAYDLKVLELFGEYAKLNFPDF